jgi:hypothetical protein
MEHSETLELEFRNSAETLELEFRNSAETLELEFRNSAETLELEGHDKTMGLCFFFGKGNENHQLDTRVFVHHRIVSTVRE